MEKRTPPDGGPEHPRIEPDSEGPTYDENPLAADPTRIDVVAPGAVPGTESLADEPATDPPPRSGVPPRSLDLPTTEFEREEHSDVVNLIEGPFRVLPWPERYIEGRRLGEGGMGWVELYQDRQIGRRVAMKFLRAGKHAAPLHLTRFVREARVQGRLEHPAIVPVYDLGINPDGNVYFTMKRVRGVTLEEIFETYYDAPAEYDEAYSRRKLLNAFNNVCLAIDYAHQHGVLHRDIKPGNVMLGDFGEVYILDWGLARTGVADEAGTGAETQIDIPADGKVDAVTQTGTTMGTPGYMSPEQMRGKLRAMGPASDVYSLGAILFEMLTLKELHERSTPGDIVNSTLRGIDARPSTRAPERRIPLELEAIVVKATALDPRLRFQSARAMYLAIERFLDGERDDTRRREMAAHHAETAWVATTEAGRDGALSSRRVAMREVGKALALDPGNEFAVQTMVQLLSTPLTETPPEVHEELENAEIEHRRWLARMAAVAYLSLLLYLPFMLWAGVRSWPALIAFFVLALASSGISWFVALSKRPGDELVLGTAVVSNLCFASTAALFGPLIVTPTLLAVNTGAFAIHLGGWKRLVSVASGLVAMLAVLLLDAVGALPGAYEFGEFGMIVRPGAIDLPRLATLAFMAVIALAAIVTAAVTASRVRDALNDAQRRLYLYTWHLRELIPRAAHGTETGARQRKLTFKVSGSR